MASSSQRIEQAPLPCPAWVWSNTSDAHAAKDRSWFSDDYTPFESFVTTRFGGSIKVIGIGTVDLPTKTSPTRTGPRSHSILRLKNVLHVPSILCNIIGSSIMRDYDISTCFSDNGSGSSGSITKRSDGSSIAYFKPLTHGVRFLEVRLSGPPIGPKVGPSPFDPSAKYAIHVLWPQSERERFAAFQASGQTQAEDAAAGSLTPAEKAWLKKHYGNEFKFLRDFGLNIFKEEYREEGRAILRALMSNDSDEADTI